MGILKGAADTVYTFRFLSLLTTPFDKTKAYEVGIIDKNGKVLKKPPFDSVTERNEYKQHYTPFIRLVFNIKKILEKAPGSGKLASYAAALYLIKEDFGVSDRGIAKVLKEYDIDKAEFMKESTNWYVDKNDKKLSLGVYKIIYDKFINESYEEVVKKYDKIRILDDCYPIGNIMGLDIYEGIHMNTSKKITFTLSEISK